jgi:glc operon protein GlcG
MTKQILTLDGANSTVTAALAHAKNLGLQEVIAVHDDSEILMALASTDGARVTSVNFAFGQGLHVHAAPGGDAGSCTHILPALRPRWSFLKQPPLTLLGGGGPIMVNGRLVSSIGASGGSLAQDIEVAHAGLTAIQD